MSATIAWQHLDRVLQRGQMERKGWLSVGEGRASTARLEDRDHPKGALVRIKVSQTITNSQHIYKKEKKRSAASPATRETQVKPHEISSFPQSEWQSQEKEKTVNALTTQDDDPRVVSRSHSEGRKVRLVW